MKHYVAAPVMALLLHLALAFAIQPYAALLADVGGAFVHGNDIADAPVMLLAGAVVVGFGWIAAAVAVVAIARRSG